MKSRHVSMLVVLAWTLAWSTVTWGAGPPVTIAAGSGTFTFVDEKGDPSREMTVYTYRPRKLEASAARIVFVMHGHGKNARGYRDVWIEHADRYQFMVVVPWFDSRHWSDAEYAHGISKDGKALDPARWSFNLVEHLFDAIRDATGNQGPTYSIYGHSEGGQFVHRLVLLLPKARYARAVAANPGWYTIPRFDVKFPYGVGHSPITETSLRESLGRDLVLLLGDRDIDPNHRDLNRSPGAMAQGVNRFERGHTFFDEAKQRAAEFAIPLGWRLQIVRGAAHENSKMSRPSAAILMDR